MTSAAEKIGVFPCVEVADKAVRVYDKRGVLVRDLYSPHPTAWALVDQRSPKVRVSRTYRVGGFTETMAGAAVEDRMADARAEEATEMAFGEEAYEELADDRLFGKSTLESDAERERQRARTERNELLIEGLYRARAAAAEAVAEEPAEDNWRHRSATMRCRTCMYYVPKGDVQLEKDGGEVSLGRCRRRAPTLDGWPAVYDDDWCGDHKLDAEKA